MRVLLIRPWVNNNITTVKNFMFGEPLGIECVSTVLRELGHEVLLVDFMAEPQSTLASYLASFAPQVVGVTSQCTDVENVLRISRETKAHDNSITVLVGGVQATCFPNSFFDPSVDYVFKSSTRDIYAQVMGEIAEQSSPKTIDGVYSKSQGFVNEGHFCLNEYIVPDRSSTQRYRHSYQYTGFAPCAVVQTAYGCRNRCRFCIRWKLEGSALREVDIGEIVEQIAALDEPYIMICDNDFLINAPRLTRFCELVEQQGIRKRYMCYGSVNSILEKPELLGRLARNGLMAVIVGYEAFDDSQLAKYNKAATVDDNLRATELLHKHDIAAWGSFILHPDWSKADFKRLISYIRQLKPELITFSPLVPHPLTPLYDEYKDRLIYPLEDYDKWNFGDVLVRPSQMSLRDYYLQVVKFAFQVNMNLHSLRYIRRSIPLGRSLRMTLGFRSLLGVYLRNITTKR